MKVEGWEAAGACRALFWCGNFGYPAPPLFGANGFIVEVSKDSKAGCACCRENLMCFQACWIGSGLGLTSKIMCCHLGCLVLSLILSPGCPGATFAKQAQGYLGKPHGIRYVLVQSYQIYNVLFACSVPSMFYIPSAARNLMWIPV